jgi:hypothetical protein
MFACVGAPCYLLARLLLWVPRPGETTIPNHDLMLVYGWLSVGVCCSLIVCLRPIGGTDCALVALMMRMQWLVLGFVVA